MPGDNGAAILDAALGYVECKITQCYDGGDHTIVVGEIVNANATADGHCFFSKESTSGCLILSFSSGYFSLMGDCSIPEQSCSAGYCSRLMITSLRRFDLPYELHSKYFRHAVDCNRSCIILHVFGCELCYRWTTDTFESRNESISLAVA